MSGLQLKLKEIFGDAVVEVHDHRGDETAVVTRESLIQIANYIKTDAHFKMDMLMDISCVDGLTMKWNPRFEVVYHFYSLANNARLRLKVRVQEKDPIVPSLTAIWPAANWFEREVWDMFGIKFEGHPELKRILMYEGFKGHPLRKDYPVNKRQPLIGPKN